VHRVAHVGSGEVTIVERTRFGNEAPQVSVYETTPHEAAMLPPILTYSDIGQVQVGVLGIVVHTERVPSRFETTSTLSGSSVEL
jgi:hypothetical protein